MTKEEYDKILNKEKVRNYKRLPKRKNYIYGKDNEQTIDDLVGLFN